MPGKCGGRGLSSSSGGGPGRRLLSYNSASSQPRPTARQTVSCADPLSDMGAHHRARGGRFGGNAKARPRGAGGASVITVRFPAAAGVSAETPLTLLLNGEQVGALGQHSVAGGRAAHAPPQPGTRVLPGPAGVLAARGQPRRAPVPDGGR